MVWPTEPIDGLDLERITDERKDVVKSEQREFTSCMAVRFCHSSRFRCFILRFIGICVSQLSHRLYSTD